MIPTLDNVISNLRPAAKDLRKTNVAAKVLVDELKEIEARYKDAMEKDSYKQVAIQLIAAKDIVDALNLMENPYEE